MIILPLCCSFTSSFPPIKTWLIQRLLYLLANNHTGCTNIWRADRWLMSFSGMCVCVGLSVKTPLLVLRVCACTDVFLSGFIPALVEKRLPSSSHHHSAAFQGHCCDWRGLMCILPELDLILGALPPGPYVRFTPLSSPPSSLLNKQKQNYLFWSSFCLPAHCVVAWLCADLCRWAIVCAACFFYYYAFSFLKIICACETAERRAGVVVQAWFGSACMCIMYRCVP